MNIFFFAQSKLLFLFSRYFSKDFFSSRWFLLLRIPTCCQPLIWRHEICNALQVEGAGQCVVEVRQGCSNSKKIVLFELQSGLKGLAWLLQFEEKMTEKCFKSRLRENLKDFRPFHFSRIQLIIAPQKCNFQNFRDCWEGWGVWWSCTGVIIHCNALFFWLGVCAGLVVSQTCIFLFYVTSIGAFHLRFSLKRIRIEILIRLLFTRKGRRGRNHQIVRNL